MRVERKGSLRRLGPGLQVLHVEDDDDWAELVRLWLTKKGISVLRLQSASELRSHLKRCTRLPECLLLDVGLKDADGLAVCDELKGSAAFQHLPIVIFSGRKLSAQECLKHQAVYRVDKAEGAEEELTAALESVLRQNERAQGVLDHDGVRLDSRSYSLAVDGEPYTVLLQGQFEALRLLLCSAPEPVEEGELYAAFSSRPGYRSAEPELAVRSTLRNYVSRLRHVIGPELGARLEYAPRQGYVYRPRHSR